MNHVIEPPNRQDFSPHRHSIFWDVLWLVLLTVYIMAGVASVPFHGDEAMQITMSRDFFTVFVNHQPQALTVQPPYTVDSQDWLRLINGSINLYTVGFSLQAAGYGENDLPPLWIWPISYDENITRGNRPTQAMLIVSRVSSALFLAVSAAILFGIGWQLRGRWTGYVASGLYALNPVVLLNGRRAMMEGSVLCFGLLAILVAILICNGRTGWRWWLALGVASGLTLASKHSGIVFVAAALGWVVIRLIQVEVRRRRDFYHRDPMKAINTPNPQAPAVSTLSRRLPSPIVTGEGGTRLLASTTFRADTKISSFPTITKGLIYLGISGMIIVGMFIALSPAQWNNPAARLRDLVSERAKLLESQVKAEPSAPTAMSERLNGIFTQPYMQTPVYFEAAFWAGAKPILAEIKQYDTSLWSGFHAGNVIGSLLTLLALVGIASVARRWRTWEIGTLVWLAFTLASLLVNPLPWQRYYLSLYPVTALFTAIGISSIFSAISQRRSST